MEAWCEGVARVHWGESVVHWGGGVEAWRRGVTGWREHANVSRIKGLREGGKLRVGMVERGDS